MTRIEIIAQIIGFTAIGESILIYASTKRKNILLFKLISDFMWLVNFLLLGAFTGALLNAIAILRELTFSQRERHKIFNHRCFLFIFLAITAASAPLTWAGPISLLPAVGSMIAVFSFYTLSTQTARYTGFAAQIFWLVYNVLLLNYSGIAGCIFTMVSVGIGFINAFKTAKQEKKAAKQE